MQEISAIDIKPAPYNPRKISEEALRGLKLSMDKFGDISGITFNKKTGQLISGHQRWSLLKDQYPDLIFQHVLDDNYAIISNDKGFTGYFIRIVDWDKSTERAANLTANNPHISGEFDGEIVPLILDEIKDEMSDIFSELNLDSLSEDFPEIIVEMEEDRGEFSSNEEASRRENSSIVNSNNKEINYGDKNKEIDTKNFGNDLEHTCPKCGFEFND